MLGISCYFKDFSDDYLKKCFTHGVRAVFTSLQLPEDSATELAAGVDKLSQLATAYQLQLLVDVSPAAFKKLQLAAGDFSGLKKLGFTSLRLDYGFDDPALICRLQQDFKIFLNASTITTDLLKNLAAAGVNLSQIVAAYNFYPKIATGLSSDYFAAKNRLLKKRQISQLAFIPGDGLKRYPNYAGLPTLEAQRGLDSYSAYLEMKLRYGVDDIFIGDSQLSSVSLNRIQRFENEKVITLPLICDDLPAELATTKLAVRAEKSPQVIRLLTARQPIPIKSAIARQPGMVTIENKLAGRYSGEVEIVKSTLPFSPASNYLGSIPVNFWSLLNLIDDRYQVVFEPYTNH
jgi:hypothetical protein